MITNIDIVPLTALIVFLAIGWFINESNKKWPDKK